MIKYIITFRLDDDDDYNVRLEDVKEFLENESTDYIEDSTTSTIFCKGVNLQGKLSSSGLLTSSDNVLFIILDDSNKLMKLIRVRGNTMYKVSNDIRQLFDLE